LFRNKFGGVAVASRSRPIGINVRLRRLTIRGPNSTRYKSRQSSWYSVKTTRSLDDATADGRDKLLATAMVQQFEKTFPELLTAAGTEVQIIETDGF
jgi:hypothetical protein